MKPMPLLNPELLTWENGYGHDNIVNLTGKAVVCGEHTAFVGFYRNQNECFAEGYEGYRMAFATDAKSTLVEISEIPTKGVYYIVTLEMLQTLKESGRDIRDLLVPYEVVQITNDPNTIGCLFFERY
jgi:hypothetical protein